MNIWVFCVHRDYHNPRHPILNIKFLLVYFNLFSCEESFVHINNIRSPEHSAAPVTRPALFFSRTQRRELMGTHAMLV